MSTAHTVSDIKRGMLLLPIVKVFIIRNHSSLRLDVSFTEVKTAKASTMQYRAAYLVILCSGLIHLNVIGSDVMFYHTADKDATSVYYISTAIAYLLYPLLGWLADAYFTRYRFVHVAFILVIAAMVLMIVVGIIFLFSPQRIYFLVFGLSIIISVLGIGLFESTAIQFGMDQMPEATSRQLSTFIHWYYWSCNVGQLIVLYIMVGILTYFSHCTLLLKFETPYDDPYKDYIHPYEFKISCTVLLFIAVLQLLMACVGLCLLVHFKECVKIDRIGDHPIKLLYQVLKYAWYHKSPVNRSAFTYWEEDIPVRIDLGKMKYGGPFTTEEVEDTKTFFRIFLLLLTLVGFHLSNNGYSLLEQLTKTQCSSNWTLMFVGEKLHITLIIILIGVPAYQSLAHVCQKYAPKIFGLGTRLAPNMLKRMGFGLLCCLLKVVIEIVIHALFSGGTTCHHIDPISIDSCFFLRSQFLNNGTCTTVTNLTSNKFFCNESETAFLWLLIPRLLHGFGILFVFMTTLEFICAQAPLRLKGLLIGIWYALLAIGYILDLVEPMFTTGRIAWEVLYEVKAFLIFLSLMLFVCVSKRYRYRQRDEVVNEQFLVEEIYEREINLAEELEKNAATEEDSISINSYTSSYGALN